MSAPLSLVAALALAAACGEPGALGSDREALTGRQPTVHVCHDGHTIVVGAPAVPAHLDHGDALGACPTGCSPEACDDANLCTSDACLPDGSCTHEPVSCADGNPCTAEACDPSRGCVATFADGVGCDDGNDCTSDDVCLQGACVGAGVAGCCTGAEDCEDGDPCTVDACVGHACERAPVVCASGDPCAAAFCDPTSGGCATAPVSCDDASSCTTDACVAGVGCTSTMVCTAPLMEPTSGYLGTPFVITDPLGRMEAGDQCTFYLPGTAAVNGLRTEDCVVQAAGTIIRCTVPTTADARNYAVAVKPSQSADSRFDDLFFSVTP